MVKESFNSFYWSIVILISLISLIILSGWFYYKLSLLHEIQKEINLKINQTDLKLNMMDIRVDNSFDSIVLLWESINNLTDYKWFGNINCTLRPLLNYEIVGVTNEGIYVNLRNEISSFKIIHSIDKKASCFNEQSDEVDCKTVFCLS